jgi:hypothetical protein
MMRRPMRPLRRHLWILIALIAPARALAEPRDDARRHFRLGLEAAQAGQYEVALAEFQAAQQAWPHPVTVYNIARSYQDLGDVANAISWYELYREAAPDKAGDVDPILAVLRAQQQTAAAPESGPTGTATGDELARLRALADEVTSPRRGHLRPLRRRGAAAGPRAGPRRSPGGGPAAAGVPIRRLRTRGGVRVAVRAGPARLAVHAGRHHRRGDPPRRRLRRARPAAAARRRRRDAAVGRPRRRRDPGLPAQAQQQGPGADRRPVDVHRLPRHHVLVVVPDRARGDRAHRGDPGPGLRGVRRQRGHRG